MLSTKSALIAGVMLACLPLAFALFMIPGVLLYLWAMVGGRARDWRWFAGALAAPASRATRMCAVWGGPGAS